MFQTISDRVWKSIWDRFWKISNLTVFGPFCWRRRFRDHHFRPCCCHRRWGKQGISVASPNLSVARLSLPSIFAAAWTTPTTKKMMMMTTTTNMAIQKSHPSDVICSAHAHALFLVQPQTFSKMSIDVRRPKQDDKILLAVERLRLAYLIMCSCIYFSICLAVFASVDSHCEHVLHMFYQYWRKDN